MYGEPNWLASYRAKKMTRRAFSVYRSNMFPLEKLPLDPLFRPLRILGAPTAIFVLFHLPRAIDPGKTTRLGADISFHQSYIGSALPTSHPFGLTVGTALFFWKSW
jgi:hypothetical protein